MLVHVLVLLPPSSAFLRPPSRLPCRCSSQTRISSKVPALVLPLRPYLTLVCSRPRRARHLTSTNPPHLSSGSLQLAHPRRVNRLLFRRRLPCVHSRACLVRRHVSRPHRTHTKSRRVRPRDWIRDLFGLCGRQGTVRPSITNGCARLCGLGELPDVSLASFPPVLPAVVSSFLFGWASAGPASQPACSRRIVVASYRSQRTTSRHRAPLLRLPLHNVGFSVVLGGFSSISQDPISIAHLAAEIAVLDRPTVWCWATQALWHTAWKEIIL